MTPFDSPNSVQSRTRATSKVARSPGTPRVLLVSMPFVSISTPSIGISILKSVLDGHGIPCDLRYGNLRFAEWVGFDTYSLLDERVSDALFAGDWLFAQHLFGDRLQLDVYAETLRVNTGEAEYRRIMDARGAIGPFLHACLEEFRVEDYDIIGFTTTFEQNLASLAASRLIKKRWPGKAIVFGGGNCEGHMGRELHRSFPWIDYVCSGEGEDSFPQLIEAIAAGREPLGIPGIIHRRNGRSVDNGWAKPITDMNAVPPPNYDEYFSAVGRSPLAPSLHPSLLIETSRGCWWGLKSHCTFCGLNGATMNFRSKDASRVLDELEGFRTRYPTNRVVAVDNILDMRYFRDLLPQLRDRQLGITLFYETKANLTKEQVKLLRDAGVLAIQPGVESLSTHVLQLMRKGVTALQNIQLLKWCRQYGVTVAWNLLYGFPGETADDYAAIGKVMESLWHLPPPTRWAPCAWIVSHRISTRPRRSGWSTSVRWTCTGCSIHFPRIDFATSPTSSISITRTAGRLPPILRTSKARSTSGARPARAVSRRSAAARRSCSSPIHVRTRSIAALS